MLECDSRPCAIFFFFNDTATTEIYTLSLHDALPIFNDCVVIKHAVGRHDVFVPVTRSEEHTSELQSHHDIVCRLLLEKKKKSRGLTPPLAIIQFKSTRDGDLNIN